MESKEFDVTLGGMEQLPFSANSLKFAASRSVEIAAMTESILHPSKTKLIFQTLPVHMRRRVMSHNAKRLPRKLREGHLEQMKKSGLPPKQKRPSRKYRRRPGNLLEEYNRRQRRNVWLETHIWHAKRFHMIERWGHRIANAPCDKAFRACYRASSVHCLIQDISYFTPIQITGPETLIKDMFSCISNSSCGLGICAKAYIESKREGSIHLFENRSFPFGYIGRINFIWTKIEKSKVLWLFVHPSQTKQVQCLLENLTSSNAEPQSSVNPEKRRKLTNIYAENIKIEYLPGTFNRFRLTGPKSHAILMKSLKCVNDIDLINGNKWISRIGNSELYLQEKHEYWEKASNAMSPSQLPSRMILGLVVRDPRLSRPNKRTKAMNNNGDKNSQLFLDIPPFLSESPLWDCALHNVLKKEMLTNTQFIEHVTKTQLIPGEVNMNDPALQSVPVVLIQRPGSQDPSKKIGYGSGWDIIVPPGYGVQFWQTFIMFGARSGGLRESKNLAFEMGEVYLPPDSISGQEEEQRIENELKNKYFRLPPSKRVNFVKLGIVTPFICPWKILLHDWSNCPVDDFFVLRERELLNNIQDCITNKKRLPQIENLTACLVPIYLKTVLKGNLAKNAIICLPQKEDLVSEPKEPHHDDPNAKVRKQKRKEHLRQMKCQKRKRSKLKKKGSETRVIITKTLQKRIKNEPSEYVKSMRELWLPSNVETIRHSCSKEIMGFLTKAAFSFTESRGCGVGYIAFNALNTLLEKNINQVLVRDVTSRQYRVANISVIKNQ